MRPPLRQELEVKRSLIRLKSLNLSVDGLIEMRIIRASVERSPTEKRSEMTSSVKIFH